LENKRYHLDVWVGGRWRERVWSDVYVRHHVDSAVKERERLFKLKHSDFSDDLSAKACADALRKLSERMHASNFKRSLTQLLYNQRNYRA